jgi:DNA-binding MarR family transcriptional regulator
MPAPLGLGVGMVKQKFPDDPVQSLERLTRLIRADEHTGDLNPAQWSALRYLSRCNRFSNAPAALTRYLGATKGTVSQTLIALERKGLIEKSVRPGEARSVILSLTEEGEKRLLADPWNILDELLGSSTKSREQAVGHISQAARQTAQGARPADVRRVCILPLFSRRGRAVGRQGQALVPELRRARDKDRSRKDLRQPRPGVAGAFDAIKFTKKHQEMPGLGVIPDA